MEVRRYCSKSAPWRAKNQNRCGIPLLAPQNGGKYYWTISVNKLAQGITERKHPEGPSNLILS